MDTPSWISRLSRATTAADVIAVVNDYVATRDSGMLASLPQECGVRSVVTPKDVADCAYTLAAYHGHDENARVVQRLAAFFARAAVRLAEISRGPMAVDTGK